MMGAYGVLKNGDSVELHWNDNSDVLSSVAGMKVFSTADNRNAQEDAEDFANLLAAGIDCPGDGWYATKVDGTSCCLMISFRNSRPLIHKRSKVFFFCVPHMYMHIMQNFYAKNAKNT